MKMSVLSTQFFSVNVNAILNGAQHNPTADPVQFAFVVDEAAEPETWTAGVWETGGLGPSYVAKINVGPSGSVLLAPGSYTAWMKVTDSPEVPVMKVGFLDITDP